MKVKLELLSADAESGMKLDLIMNQTEMRGLSAQLAKLADMNGQPNALAIPVSIGLLHFVREDVKLVQLAQALPSAIVKAS